jgi:lipid A ethanolaminephosphotransferase
MGNWATGWGNAWLALILAIGTLPSLKFLGLAGVTFATNRGAGGRFKDMFVWREWIGTIQLAVEWCVVVVALLVVTFHPNPIFRWGWGVAIAAASSIEWLFYRLSGNRLSVFDLLSLLEVKNWTTDVSGLMKRQARLAGGLFVLALLLIVLPEGAGEVWAAAMIDHYHLAWLPLLCVGFIVIENVVKKGSTQSPMPAQFNLPALLLLHTFKSLFISLPRRRPVEWVPQMHSGKQNLVLLVDESVRGDYVSFEPGNQLTPGLAALCDKFTSFGPAVSGGNCSSYSNVILRFGTIAERLVETAQTNPSLFSFAKKAGYRTVYIDAQAGYQAQGTGMQNFMTLPERLEIDGFYVVKTGPGHKAADFQLADIIATELKSAQPVFIYAIKSGAHYPYENRFPQNEEVYEPQKSGRGQHTLTAMIASYRNAIRFSVQKFMLYIFANADLSNTTLIYTSDHGQWFNPNHFPHGAMIDPDPRTGIVPLWAYSSDKITVQRFKDGARKCRGKASHFLIAPTLYELMGYARDDIAQIYEGSMFAGTQVTPRMSTGDVFGFFNSTPMFWDVDLARDYFEHDAQPRLKAARVLSQPQGSDQVLTLV